MGKGAFLKGLIFKDSENGSTEPEKAAANSGTAVNPVTSYNSVSTGSPSIKGVADNKFIEMLEKIIEESNMPGPDYFEFKQATENMKTIVPDERIQFQTVFSVLSLQKCTKEVLLSSLDHYVQIIQNEKANFDAEVSGAYKEKVQGKMDQANRAKQELEGLTKRMAELNNLVLSLSQEAQAEEMKIKATEANFKASADIIINEMLSDKQKIINYIQ